LLAVSDNVAVVYTWFTDILAVSLTPAILIVILYCAVRFDLVLRGMIKCLAVGK